jgi:hypothetical protein
MEGVYNERESVIKESGPYDDAELFFLRFCKISAGLPSTEATSGDTVYSSFLPALFANRKRFALFWRRLRKSGRAPEISLFIVEKRGKTGIRGHAIIQELP